ncbi:phosphopantetheine-binding protein [Streptomyces sp. NPDC057148]|uniref:phosphopantetheine-binding protein n=1 Tax=unclassified Streptomyces TaxID=2593676 RepID=UPI003633C3AD
MDLGNHGPLTERSPLFETIRRNVLVVVPDLDPSEITIDRSLSDLGCNSVDRADVVTMTMEDLGIQVPVAEFAAVHDLRSLTALLERHHGGQG